MDAMFTAFGDMGKDPRMGGGDSFCDRLNCTFTVFMLALFSIIVTTRVYVGDQVSCWAPSHFTDSHVEYTNKVCWTTNTYYLPFSNDRIPKHNDRAYIGYYQWVSLILSCQAVLFYLPRPIWRLFSKNSGIAVSTITDAAIECQRKTDADSRDKTIRYMTKHMGRFLLEMARNQLLESKVKKVTSMVQGNYLIMLYLMIKLIYISNVIVQIFLLNVFLGMDFHMYGWYVLTRMINGQDWTTSDRFPRVTLCDFKIRELGNINKYTVQCSLPVNLFNEKIFIFLWFWFAFVAFATVGSLVMWLMSSLVMQKQIEYVKTRLISMEVIRYRSKEESEVKVFVRSYLRRDGLFLIRLVSKNSSDLIAAELVSGLWQHYQEHKNALSKLTQRLDRDENRVLMDTDRSALSVQMDDIDKGGSTLANAGPASAAELMPHPRASSTPTYNNVVKFDLT